MYTKTSPIGIIDTISCITDQYRDDMSCPVLSIVEAGAQAVHELKLDKEGVISTCFTANSSCYSDQIAVLSPQTKVIS